MLKAFTKPPCGLPERSRGQAHDAFRLSEGADPKTLTSV